MKPSTEDLLYHIFEESLLDSSLYFASHKDFVTYVVCEYLKVLRSQNPISCLHMEDICRELEEDVWDMLRKKTYGFFSIQHYRKQQN